MADSDAKNGGERQVKVTTRLLDPRQGIDVVIARELA